LGVVILTACAAASPLIALRAARRGTPRHLVRRITAIALVALGVRAGLSLVQDGGLYDVFHAYRVVGEQLRRGGDVFVEPALGLSNYPPAIYWWWALTSAVPPDHPHLYAALVKLPFWLGDAAIAPLLVVLAIRRGAAPAGPATAAGWMYALNPIAAAVPTLHGQFDPLVLLPLLCGVTLLRERPVAAGLLIGIATAVKPWPLFFLLPLLALVERRRRPGFVVAVAAVPAATFALYGLVHHDHLLAGMYRVATYVAHRQGLGTSLLFGDSPPAWALIGTNIAAGAASSAAGLMAARRGRSPAETVAVAMLVLLTLSPTVSDQYVMWPLPFLLLAGRLRIAALLSAGLLPAVAALNLWTSQNDGATPAALLLPATGAMGLAAWTLLRDRHSTREKAPSCIADAA